MEDETEPLQWTLLNGKIVATIRGHRQMNVHLGRLTDLGLPYELRYLGLQEIPVPPPRGRDYSRPLDKVKTWQVEIPVNTIPVDPNTITKEMVMGPMPGYGGGRNDIS